MLACNSRAVIIVFVVCDRKWEACGPLHFHLHFEFGAERTSVPNTNIA